MMNRMWCWFRKILGMLDLAIFVGILVARGKRSRRRWEEFRRRDLIGRPPGPSTTPPWAGTRRDWGGDAERRRGGEAVQAAARPRR
jgi:hypothetical protein